MQVGIWLLPHRGASSIEKKVQKKKKSAVKQNHSTNNTFLQDKNAIKKWILHNPIVSGMFPCLDFFPLLLLFGRTEVGSSGGPVCGTTGTFLRSQTGITKQGYCWTGGLWGVKQWNVLAHRSCTATLFSHWYNPYVCTQAALGTDF